MNKMNKLITIGELLIDFTSQDRGLLKHVTSFVKNAGGAPANVAVCHQKLGGQSLLITKLGSDPFGDYLFDVIKQSGVCTDYIVRTNIYQTSLAFVSITDTGERDFTFYRNNASDLNLEPDEIPSHIFQKGDILHFCSVDLVDSPSKQAHLKAIEIARKHDVVVSFDPNLRFSLWPNALLLKDTVLSFIPLADILKISDDELTFITGITDQEVAIASLFIGHVQTVILTKGAAGAFVYTRNGYRYFSASIACEVKDTTGAGDAFIGAFLHQLLAHSYRRESLISGEINYDSILTFAHHVAAFVVQRSGAIPAMPSHEEIGNA